jgi:hypothetical protein
MTLDELLAREAIRATIARYNVAGDRLRIDDYVACFAEDGIIEVWDHDRVHQFRYEGRKAIRAWQARWQERTAGDVPVHQASFVRHHLSTCRIDLTGPDTARTTTYWTAWTDVGPDHAGVYADEFRKIGDEWLIAHRRVREDWRSPHSLFGTAVAHSR